LDENYSSGVMGLGILRTVRRAEGEPIALEAALGRGRIYARSVCDAAPACGPEGHRLARSARL